MKVCKMIALAFVAIALSSCDENVKKVEEVTKQFVEGVNTKDKVLIYEMYPNSRNFSNLQFPDTIKVEGLKVEFDETDSVYLAKLNDKQTLVCIIDSAGIKISDSYNVLKLDSTCYDLAAKTGFPVKQMSDMTVGKMFSDEGDFMFFLQGKYPSVVFGNLSSTPSYYSWGRNNGSWFMIFESTVTNNSENPVKGEDYFVEISYFRGDTGTSLGSTDIEKGVDLAPGESFVYKTNHPAFFQYNPNNGSVGCGVTWRIDIKFKNASKAVMLSKYGSFTGKEYEEYLNKLKETKNEPDSLLGKGEGEVPDDYESLPDED